MHFKCFVALEEKMHTRNTICFTCTRRTMSYNIYIYSRPRKVVDSYIHSGWPSKGWFVVSKGLIQSM